MKWHEQTTRHRGDLGGVDKLNSSRREELDYFRPFGRTVGGSRTINGRTKRGFWFRRYYRP